MKRGSRQLLSKAGTSGDQKLDQYFLTDDRILDRLQEYALNFNCQKVLEVGAGIGNLTDKLVQISEEVIAVEIDSRLVGFLKSEFKEEICQNNLHLIHGDILSIDLPSYTLSVSNLPYELSSKILFKLLPNKVPMILMVQKEFANRLCAKSNTPEYGRITITTGHYADVEILEIVPPSAFNVKPAVESAIVKLVPSEPEYNLEDERVFLNLVTAVFTQRRKKMSNAIRNTTHISCIENPDQVIRIMDEKLMNSRPGELSPAQFAEISNVIAKSKEN